ncbi:MAG: phage tail tape measure protein [Fusobacteriaceae bacterium]|jgi:TP901 family phage tail tape measure protein|nr:phage tail tape measure protein [Fusobacteriaceae bacterium]
MANKQMDLVLSLKAKIDKMLPQSLDKVSNKIKDMQNKLKELKKIENMQSNQKTSFEQYKKAADAVRKNRNELKTLMQAKASGAVLTKQEEKRINELNKANAKLTNTMNKHKSSFKNYSMELQKLKIPYKNMRNEINKTIRDMQRMQAQQTITAKVGAFKDKAKQFGKNIVSGGFGIAKKATKYIGAAGIAAGGYVAKESINAYIDFNANMKRVQAISGATAAEYDMLEKKAMQMGATTKFTAGQSAAAMEKMALAGFNTKQIIAAIPGVLNLAAASGEDVAMVSDIITDALVPFNLTAEDTGKFADVLAYTMSKTNTNVNMVGEAFKYASGGAGILGVSLEETAASLGLMADQAIKGSSAGTSLNNIFVMAAKNQKKIKGYGIKTSDKKGNFVGMVSLLEQVEKTTAKMGDLEQEKVLIDMFGKKGFQGIAPLLKAKKTINGKEYKGSAALKMQIEATEKDSIGASEKMKDVMLEGAAGVQVLLSSAWDGVKVSLGKMIFSPFIMKKLKTLTDYIGSLANILNGVWDTKSTSSMFWVKLISDIKVFIIRMKIALKPGIEIIKTWLPNNPGSNFFSFLTETLVKLAKVFSIVIKRANPFIKLIQKIGIGNIAIFITLVIIIYKIIGAFKELSAAMTLINAAGGIFTVLKMVFTAMGGPLFLIIAGIVALGIIIYRNWDKIKVALAEFVTFAKEKLATFYAFFKENEGAFNFILGPIKFLIDGALEFYNAWDSNLSIIDNIKNGFTAFFESIKENFTKMINFIKETPIGKAVTSGIEFAEEQIGAFISWIKEKWNAIKDFLSFPEPPAWLLKLIDKVGIGGKKGATKTNVEIDGSNAKGLNYVPFDGYISELHRGERILTAEENVGYGNLLGKLFNGQSRTTSSITNDNQSAYIFNPIITISGGTDANTIQELREEMKKMMQDFKKTMKEKDDNYVDGERTKF